MIRAVVTLTLWAGALWGALALRHAPGAWGHSLCGPWGCGPPLQALLAVHGAWLLLLLPAGVATIASPRVPLVLKRTVANGLVVIGTGAIVVVLGYQGFVWRTHSSVYAGEYLLQRCAFALLTTVDFPTLQALVTGLWMQRRLRLAGATAGGVA